MGMCTNCPAYFAEANSFACLGQTFFRTPEFVEHQRKLQAKCDWLSMNPMAAPDHRSHFESPRLLPNRRPQRFDIVQKNFAGLCQLYGERRVQDIRRS